MITCDVVIVGGGAAGLMGAIEAGKRGRRVLVVERNPQVGRKILISGGGRCNFTNLHTGPENFLSANPHFCKSALARYTPSDFTAIVERYGIGYHEKEWGQLFCDGPSRQIVQMLLNECRRAGVCIEVNTTVASVEPGAALSLSKGFALETSLGPVRSESLMVASGGLSIPKMGATGFGYELARRFGHSIVETRPALVPLTLGQDILAQYAGLSGVSLPVEARCNGVSFARPMLFTHRGLSGPAILQLSSYWCSGGEISVDLLPGHDTAAWLGGQRQTRPAAALPNVLSELLPKRLAQRLCELALGIRPLRQYPEPELQKVAQHLHDWRFRPMGTEGYRTAEVTLGGVDTDELSSTTMESKKLPGLYFIGEVVDVTGHLGGFNFQWAWASGHAAGQVV